MIRGAKPCGWAALGLLALTAACAGAERWSVLTDCRLIPNDSNDGDSFHVKAGRRHYILRLYFVDAPETDDSYPERVKEQAEYWDVTSQRAVSLGKKARAFAARFLADGFTVHTRRQNAQGRSNRQRFYALVETRAGYLADALVSNGLARVFGQETDLPDGTEARRYWTRLRALERGAKKRAVGGWAGPRAGGPQLRLPPQQPAGTNRPPADGTAGLPPADGPAAQDGARSGGRRE